MSARDEREYLAELLEEEQESGRWASSPTADLYGFMADAVLAAGYRRPRTITTAEELDALPDGVLILTEQGGYWESVKRADGLNWWHEPGRTNVFPSEDLTFPATVIYEGGAA